MPFEGETLNVGNAFNVTSGVFTAPRTGTYFFAFSSLSDQYYGFYFYLTVNDTRIANCDAVSQSDGRKNCYILYTVKLVSGDEVKVSLKQGSISSALFTGVLLAEDIFQS
jgi:hypothetical protein